MNKIYCDLAIIGGGAGGLSVAAGAAQLGAKVVLLEQGRMGGDCLNYGCVPSKALIAAAKRYWQATHASAMGIHCPQAQLSFSQVMQHVKHVIAHIAVHDSVERFTDLGVTVIQLAAKFIDSTTLQAGEQQVVAKRIVIATGSSAFIPPIPGIESVSYYTNETIFDLVELPEHLLVVGGGPIGCELAQAFAMLGSKVTVLEGNTILPKDEMDCVAIVRQQLLATGVTLYEGALVKKISEHDSRIQIDFEQDKQLMVLHGSHALIAAGRRANVKTLELEQAGVTYSDKGIQVDSRLRTSNKKIFAMGDVIGGLQFTHVAGYHAGIIIKNILFRMPAKVNYKAVPWVTYTQPELAHVGLTMTAAQAQGLDIVVTELAVAENDRAQAEGETFGKIKVLTNKKGTVLGVTIVADSAGELLTPWIMLIQQGKTLRALTDTIIPYPTLSEINKRVAGLFYQPQLFSPKVKRIVRWLLKWM